MFETEIPLAVEPHQDQLNEVRLELGLKVQTMMQIDTNNTFEKVFCLILVFVVTFITVVVSIGFHSQIHVNSTVIKIPLEDNFVKGEASLMNISPFNRFSYIQIKFRRMEPNSDFNSKIHVSFQVAAFNDETSPHYIISQSVDEIRNVVFRKNAIESEKITLFSDKKLISKEYKLFLSISGRTLQSLTYLEINWGYGDRTITYAFIIIHVVYMLIIIIMFGIYTKFIYRIKFRVWTIEQKLTYFLIIFCFFSDYPLNGIYIGEPTKILMIISIVFNSLFQSFTHFYTISLFRSLKGQLSAKDFSFVLFIFSLFFIITLIDIISTIINYINLYNFRLQIFRFIPKICETSLDLLTIIIIVVLSASSDETEFSRFITYSAHTFLMLIVTFPVKILKNEIQLSYIASLIESTGYNLFVISMCYFHWPYTVMTNTSYQDSSMQEIKEGIMIDKIADNPDDSKKNEIDSTNSFDASDENNY